MVRIIPAFLKSVPSSFLHTASQPFSNLRYAQDFSALVRNLSRNRNNPRLLAAVDSTLAKTPLLDSTTSVLVLRGLSRCKKLTRAKAVLSGLKERGTIPEPFLYSLVLQCLVPESPIRDVESVWREIGSGPSNRCMDASDFVLYLCRRSEDAAEIERVCHRVSSSRWDLRREGYVALIGAMCEGNNPNPGLARNVLREMEEKGFEADELTYFALFQSFCRTGDVLEADSVLRTLVDRWDHELDISVYGNFFYSLCKSGRLREARKLFDKLAKKDRGLEVNPAPCLKPGRRVIFQLSPSNKVTKVMTFEAYVRSLCSAGRVEDAERMLKEAARKSMVPEICVCRSFIEALFRAGRVDDAIGFFEAEKRRRHAEAGAMAAAVIEGLCEMGRVDEGCRLLCEMVDEGFVPTAKVWNWILESYWEEGRVWEATGLFDRMRSGICGGGGARPTASTYSVMIHGFLRKGDIMTAISLLEDMAREKMPVSFSLCSGVALSIHAQGELELLHDYLNKMIENGILVSYAAWELLFESMTIRNEVHYPLMQE
ncbi:putative pentatricopeptide repeat-containing protein At1g12700, mitochondrial [Phoenix dactylifera]|uniref:Pentatricopeptide repeat-containing protein At1g12700, mitochondrial n=1 Tax=Phoenix dactylifera TaxID=42345 RepID=A0A8B7BIX1_PHODC|nr:putative pentatricopeptide repeat-containing protein At1g12700, mitochondrial [Phoenix dactylifera]